jgi:hypothetical protein
MTSDVNKKQVHQRTLELPIATHQFNLQNTKMLEIAVPCFAN